MATVELLTETDRILADASMTIPGGPRPVDPYPVMVIDERKLLQAALEQPYDGEDVRKSGLTKLAASAMSVANQAADGIPWAVQFVFDRMYGKPKQTVQSVNLSMTLKEYLQQLAASANQPQDAEIV